MKYPGFRVKEFFVPEFELTPGKMIRFWVQILPEKENQTDGYWAVKRIVEIIEKYNNQNLGAKIHLCPIKLKIGPFDFIKPIKVKEYLEKVFGVKSNKIKDDLSSFNIKPEYTIREMGYAHQKLFSIICGIEQYDITAFDFYGFDPDTEIRLMKYIHVKLDEGKSLLAFDNLGYKEENFDILNVENIMIERV
ncbi:hypothetical protein [Aquimarina sp. RZ0]|uniref:hypothetical protein n=1 Tax=Aquimarina sp. RZ0 TaxID=2607730 RepID=UPI0011F12E0E|nr:hypothetical protein [Aquimarina sp. RZ0]KAA1247650.1 hypothetical protein F0000_02255 [Aquimarina sp. RZ0]